MTDPRDSQPDKRARILAAAIRVFARKGYQGSRVADIAEEAGVAYGLVYHYFNNKETILNEVFETHWGVLLRVIGEVHASGGSLEGKLRRIASFIVEVWRQSPALVEVLILEIVRSPKFLDAARLRAFTQVFRLLEDILKDHQGRGEVRADLDPHLAAFVFMGAIEVLLTGYVTRVLDAEQPDGLERARDTAVDVFLCGILPAR